MKLSDYHPSMEGATPVPAAQPAMLNAQPQIPNSQTQVSPYLRTTVPLPLQYAPDTLKQYNRPGLSSFRTSPVGPNGIPGINAAVSSTSTTNIHEFATVAAVGPNGAVQFNNNGSLDGVSQFEWLNTTSTLVITGSETVTGTLIAQAVTGQFNVKVYGAKGNGTTDDTVAINNAVTAAVNAGGGTVYFPAGTYLTSSGIILSDTVQINIAGDSRDTTTIKLTSAQTAVIYKGNGGLVYGNVIRDLQIDGNLLATYGIRLLQGKSWLLQNLRVQKVVVSTGEGITLGESAVSTAEFYQCRLLNIDVAFESGTYTSGNRPLNGIHFLQSATDNQIAFYNGWNMTNAGIVDEASDNRYTQIHVYGFPLTTYYPAYAMEVTANCSITHLTSDGVLTAGVHVKGKWVTITDSMFQWPTGGTVSGAFPVLADAAVDYLNVSNNTIFQAQGITISGAQTAVSFNGSLTPPNDCTVLNNSGTDNTGTALNLVNFFPKQQYVWGQITPKGAIAVATPFTTQPTVYIRKITSQSADLLQIVDTNGSTVLANVDVSGNIKGQNINSLTGFQYNSAAPSGHILVGNGTVYVDGTISGSAFWNTLSKTTTYTAVAGDMVLASTSGGGFTVTLPSASANTNKSIRVKKTSSDANTIVVASSDNIDGLASQSWTAQYTEIEVISDGTTWWIA